MAGFYRYYSKIQSDVDEIRCPKEHGVLDVCHCDDYTITIHFGTEEITCTENDVKISTYAMVRIDYTVGVPFDDFWTSELLRFQAFLIFCFGARPAIRQIRVTFANNSNPVDVYKSTLPTKKIRENFQYVPVPFRLVKKDLSTVVTRWMKMRGDEARSSEMLTSLLGPWKMPIDLQLFAATSMLESLARVGSKKLYADDELRSLISPMLATADEKIHDKAQGLLRLLQRPSYRMLLNNTYDESGAWGKEIVPNWEKFREEQIRLRNAGAHALGNGGEYEKMVDHYYAQILIAYVIIMKRLGLCDEALKQFENSSFLEAPRQQIRKRYPKPTGQR